MVWAMGESDSGGLVVGPASVRVADVQFRDLWCDVADSFDFGPLGCLRNR